jgi:hypothetical protein
MKLFPKKTSDTPVQPGRRRPLAHEQEAKRTQAFSYYARRSSAPASAVRGSQNTDSEAGKDQDAITPKNRLIIALSGLVLIAGAAYMLTLSGDPKIVTKAVGGGTYFMQEPRLYEQTVTSSLQSSLFNKSKLSIDTARIVKDLTDNYPEIASAKVQLPLIGRRPVVVIEPHRPSFILTTIESTAFLLDENGRALVSTSQITDPGELSVPTLQDKTGIPVTLGSQALPTGTIAFTEAVLRILKAANVEYSSLSLPPASSELDVAVTGKPYFVKFNIQGDARLQAGTFIATKLRLEKDRVTPGQYIDVRVPERAYYR